MLLGAEFFPEMVPPMMTTKNDALLVHEYHTHNEQSFTGGSRKLLDMYGDSLKFVNRLLNLAFGPTSRKVPAHMPHMIDKKMVESLQQHWSAEFDATSSHQLRDPHDMQYAFSYFYFLMQQKQNYTIQQIWEIYLDVDKDGYDTAIDTNNNDCF
jgi:hypothetical protein